MNRRVLLILILVVVLIGGGVAALMFLGGGGDESAESTETLADLNLTQADIDATGTASVLIQGDSVPSNEGTLAPVGQVALAPVVIALQDLPRGFRLTREFLQPGPSQAVDVTFWPVESVPRNGFDNVEALEGLLIRSDIPRESPVLSTQLVDDVGDLAEVGSDAALLLPPGTVGMSMPLDAFGVGAIAFGMQPGDFVDIILSFLFIEVDETFQSRQPNEISVITRDEAGNLIFGQPLTGRPEPSTLSSLGVLVSPTETQRPRLVTQRTVERAYVVHVGYFPPDGRILGIMSPTPFITDTPDPSQPTPSGAGGVAALPTATEYVPTIVTLGVEPQDALVLAWALDSQIPTTYVLRAVNDASSTPTTAVTLQYLIENYSIPRPPILDFALEPPIRSLRGSQLDLFRGFADNAPTTSNAPAQ